MAGGAPGPSREPEVLPGFCPLPWHELSRGPRDPTAILALGSDIGHRAPVGLDRLAQSHILHERCWSK
jgi:hypothetical protein